MDQEVVNEKESLGPNMRDADALLYNSTYQVSYVPEARIKCTFSLI